MMMNHSLKNQFNLRQGSVIEGKWHRNHYVIERELGYGANGIVYLARSQSGPVALKMSDNGLSITSEVNVLKSFAKVQGSALGPYLLDVDDWIYGGKQISFYVMEYIQGPQFLSFIQQKGHAWTDALILQLLNDLEKLHDNGWVFGDLKPENLIVTGPPSKIRCIDVGGTTMQGRAIKEFTEFYDRGYWGLGSRKADPGYDLFAVAMIMINTAYPNRFSKTTGGLNQLMKMINEKNELKKYEHVLSNALQGKYTRAEEMRISMLETIQNNSGRDVSYSQRSASRTRKKVNISRQGFQKGKKRGGVLETVSIFVIISLLYLFYIFGQVV